MANNMNLSDNSFSIRDIMDVTPSQRIAMLIDGDNAQPSMIEKMLAETTKYGLITIRRIYGDWTASNMGGWKEVLQTHAIQPIQQFRYTVGKNATDSAMIIDAMDLFYSGNVDGFKRAVLLGLLQKYLPDILYLNGKELVEHLYEEAWIEGTESEKKHFYERYVKTLSLKVDSDGNFTVEVKK